MKTVDAHANPRGASGAFTLIEIMIVVGFLALIVGMGVPSIVASLRKEGMRKAVSDVVEACVTARSSAIMTSQAVDVVIRPFERTITVSPAPGDAEGDSGSGRSGGGETPAEGVKSLTATLTCDVHTEAPGLIFMY